MSSNASPSDTRFVAACEPADILAMLPANASMTGNRRSSFMIAAVIGALAAAAMPASEEMRAISKMPIHTIA